MKNLLEGIEEIRLMGQHPARKENVGRRLAALQRILG
jgi:hypothetical protein